MTRRRKSEDEEEEVTSEEDDEVEEGTYLTRRDEDLEISKAEHFGNISVGLPTKSK